MKNGFALIMVLLLMSGLMFLVGLTLQHAVMSYSVAVAHYHACQKQYAPN